MNRKAAHQIANRALGIARLIEAGQLQAAGLYLAGLTFKIPPRHLGPLADALATIREAAGQANAARIRTEAEKLLAIALAPAE